MITQELLPDRARERVSKGRQSLLSRRCTRWGKGSHVQHCIHDLIVLWWLTRPRVLMWTGSWTCPKNQARWDNESFYTHRLRYSGNNRRVKWLPGGHPGWVGGSRSAMCATDIGAERSTMCASVCHSWPKRTWGNPSRGIPWASSESQVNAPSGTSARILMLPSAGLPGSPRTELQQNRQLVGRQCHLHLRPAGDPRHRSVGWAFCWCPHRSQGSLASFLSYRFSTWTPLHFWEKVESPQRSQVNT